MPTGTRDGQDDAASQTPRFRPSVQRQLTVLVGALVVLACLGLTAVGYFYSRGILLDETRDRLTWQADVRAASIAAWVDRQRGNVGLVSSRTQLRRLVGSFAQPDADRNVLRERSAKILRDARDASPAFREIWIADDAGEVLTGTDPAQVGTSVADDEVFLAAKEGRVVGAPTMQEGRPVAVAGGPMQNDEAQRIGTVLISIDASNIAALLGRQGAGPAAGLVTVAMETDTGWRRLFAENDDPTALEVLAFAQDGASGFTDVGGPQGDRLVAYTPIRGTHWTLAAHTTTERAYHPIRRLRVLALVTALIILCVGVLGSLWVARRFTRPLEQMVATTREISSGRLTSRVRVEGAREFMELAVAFNDMAASLHEQTTHLDELVRARTEALASSTKSLQRSETELRTALDAAQQAERARSTFLAAISHDIRSPLSAVMGMAQLMMLDAASPAQRRDFEDLHGAASSLLHLFDDILDFSRLEAGALVVDRAPYSLRRTLGEAVRVHALRAYQSGIELALIVAPDVPDRLVGDAGRLRQVVGNLVGNGAKFTPEGQVTVDVRTEADQLVITVRDTGPGIAPDQQAAVFEAFHQAGARAIEAGTGLGLAICRRLVGLMDGTLTLESELGKGAAFSVTLPLRVDDAAPREAAAYTGPRRGLLVSPHAPTHAAAVAALAPHGIELACVPDLEAGATAWGDADPEFVIADDRLWSPVESAPLHERIESAEVPLILLTPPGGSVALGSGVYILRKPILERPLLDVIRETTDPQAAKPHQLGATTQRTVLVVDDAAVIREVTVRMLRRRGHLVREAHDGEEALQLLEDFFPDVVLLDLHMPVRDGWSTARAIRRLQTGRRSRIIALSAHATTADRDRVAEAGMDGFLVKPADLDALFEAVEAPDAAEDGPAESTSNETSAAVLNMDAALARVGGSRETLHNLATTLKREVTRLMDPMRQAIASEDDKAAALAVHALKGSLDVFGAERAVATAWDMECRWREGALDGATAAIDRLGSEIEEMYAQFDAAMGDGTS